jgi:hypothetical protein
MKKLAIILILFIAIKTNAQNGVIRNAISFYPLEKQIGWRGNLGKSYFTDVKAGMTISAIPFITFEMSRCKRIKLQPSNALYIGAGLTFDSFVPGAQMPFGFEFIPFTHIDNLSFIVEVSPKVTFGPINFLNTNMNAHIGCAYYLN